MKIFEKTLASDLLLNVTTYLKTKEKGPLITASRDSTMTGAQCANCQSVVWFNVYLNPILQQRIPEGIPDFGPEYILYNKNRWATLLEAFPNCPHCGKNSFDRAIRGGELPRFNDGSELVIEGNVHYEAVKEDPKDHEVWKLIDDQQSQVFRSAWIKFIGSKQSNEEE